MWLAIIISLSAYSGLLMQYHQTQTLTFASTPATLGWYTFAFFGYIGLLAWIEVRKEMSLWVIFGGAVLFRVLLLFMIPTLSGDVYRYIWEGHIINQGVNPYAYPIDSPILDYLAIPQRAQVDHAWMASPYLPGAQLMFAVVMAILPLSPTSFQFAMSVFDIGTGLLLVQLLRLAKLPDYRVYLYLWNPLVVLEIAQGAHLDGWMIFLTLLALWVTWSARFSGYSFWLSPILLAVATLTKGVPILLTSVLFWQWRWWQLWLFGGVILAIITPLGLNAGWGLSGDLDGHGLFAALRIFADRWNYNSGIFHWLERYFAETMPLEMANFWAKRGIGGLMAVIGLSTWLLSRYATTPRSRLRWMTFPLAGYVFLSTTVHPWYILIMLAFMPFLTPTSSEKHWLWPGVLPWLYLSWAITLSYWTYINPADLREFPWVRNIEWLPTLALFMLWGAFQFVRMFTDKRQAATSEPSG